MALIKLNKDVHEGLATFDRVWCHRRSYTFLVMGHFSPGKRFGGGRRAPDCRVSSRIGGGLRAINSIHLFPLHLVPKFVFRLRPRAADDSYRTSPLGLSVSYLTNSWRRLWNPFWHAFFRRPLFVNRIPSAMSPRR
jgi:hypothetical protein